MLEPVNPLPEPKKTGSATAQNLGSLQAPVAMAREEVRAFTKNLALLMDAGVSVTGALNTLAKIEERGSVLKPVLRDVRKKIEGGAMFSESLAEFPAVFDKSYTTLVKAGELGGVLEVVLHRLTDFENLKVDRREPKWSFVTKEQSEWCAKFGIMLSCGVPILQVLTLLERDSKGLLAEATREIHREIREGETITGALVKYPKLFAPQFVAMVDVGEQTGALPEILMKLSELGNRQPLGKAVEPLAVFTNGFYLLVDAGLPVLRSLRVLERAESDPRLKEAIGKVALSIEGGSTCAEAFAQHPDIFNGYYINMIKAGELGGCLEVSLGKLADRLQQKEKTPKWSFVTDEQSEWCGKFGMLISCGVPVLQTLTLLANDSKGVLAEATREIHKQVREGETISGALAKFPETFAPQFLALIDAGECTGALPEVLTRLAERSESPKLRKPDERLAAFTYGFGTMVDAGLPVLRSLRTLQKSEQSVRFKAAIGRIATAIESGEMLSQAFAKESRFFNRYYVNLLKVGELGGVLEVTLNKLAADIDSKGKAVKPVHSFVSRQQARWCTTLGLLLSAGIPGNQALNITAMGVGGRLGTATREVAAALNRSKSLANALRKRSDIFSAPFIEVVAAGEKSADLSRVLFQMGATEKA